MVAGSRCRDAIALIGALVLVAVAVWIVREIRTSNNPVHAATVYATYLSVTTLLVFLLAFLIPWWWNGRRATTVAASPVQITAADQLARSMLDVWCREVSERWISTPAPVRVRWRWGQRDVTPPPWELITVPDSGIGPRPLPEPHLDGSNSDEPGVLLEAGVVTQLHEVYGKLPHGRLVLLGGPGRARPAR